MKYFSALSLILANMVPVVGVLFWHWSVASIMVLYWFESLVVGIFNVLKMHRAEGGIAAKLTLNGVPAKDVVKTGLICFFLIHYGFFMLGHGIFVLVLFYPWHVPIGTLLSAIFSLVLSHGISYRTNFIGRGEYKTLSVSQLLLAPYGRIFVMHFTIVLGAFFIIRSGENIGALLIMIAVKTVIDLFSHFREHNNFMGDAILKN